MRTPISLLDLLWALLFCISAFTNRHVAAETSASVFLADSVGGDGRQYLIVEESDSETVNVICHVTDLEPNHIVQITRETRTGSGPDSLVWNNNATSSANTEHITFDGYINIGGNSYLYTLIIHDVTRHDAGDYSCQIFTQAGNRFTPLTNGSAGLRVLYLPDDIYPICTTVSANKSLTRYAGDEVTFRCESEIGDPAVFLDWTLSARGPSLPRAKEQADSGNTYSEIVVDLQEGHSGKLFECQLGTGLQITYKPKCTLGPYDVQPLPTTPRPPTQPPQLTTQSRTIIAKSTQQSDVTTLSTKTSLIKPDPSGLSSAAIAGIIVIITLLIGILMLIVIAWLIRSKRCLSFNIESKGPIDDPHGRPPSGLGGIGNLGTTLTLMMASEKLDDPELLGFKRRVSKKASLKSEADLEVGEEPYGFENGRLALDFDTINEHDESPPQSPDELDPSIPKGYITRPADDVDSTALASPKDSQPFLPSAQPNDGYMSSPSSPDMPDDESKQFNEPPGDSPPQLQSTAPPSHTIQRDDEPSLSNYTDDEELEGSYVNESDNEDTSVPDDQLRPNGDPGKPRDLPQDVMDILMELDLDLFANEEEEVTNF